MSESIIMESKEGIRDVRNQPTYVGFASPETDTRTVTMIDIRFVAYLSLF